LHVNAIQKRVAFLYNTRLYRQTGLFLPLIITNIFSGYMAETLRSMTGFGRAERSAGTLSVLAEIKSLNGKQLDLNLKLPPLLKPYEFNVRNQVAENVLRGSVECTITIKQNGATKPVILNTELYKSVLSKPEAAKRGNATGYIAGAGRLAEVARSSVAGDRGS
jgi:hypothetical protein